MKRDPIINISIFNALKEGVGMMLLFFFGIHFQNIGLSGTEMGIIFAVFAVTQIITVLPSGISSDRFKAKHLISFGLLLVAIRYFIIAETNDFFIITLMFLIAGIGKSISKVATESLFYKTTEKKNVEKKIGTFQSLGYFLVASGIICSGYLLEINFSFHKIFTVVGVLFLLLTIAAQIYLPQNYIHQTKVSHYKDDLRNSKALFLLVINFLFALHIGSEVSSYGLFLKNNLGLDGLNLGLYMGVAIIVMGFVAYFAAKKIQKIGPGNMLITGFSLSSLGYILMTIPDVWISFSFRIIHEIGDALIMFFFFFGVSKLFDLKRMGGHAGIMSLVSTIGITLSSLAFSPIGETYGHNISIIIGGIFLFIGAVLSLHFKHLTEH